MVLQKEIIYPIFLECCQYTVDSFWKNIFEDLSYGKSPYGTYINKNFLCCSYKNKEFSYKIEHKKSEKLYNDIYSLLKNKLGILSTKEKLNKKTEYNTVENKIKECRQKWVDIKKKNIKDLLIERYVVDMKNKCNLTIKQSKYLLSILFIAIVFKVITSDDIHYSDGKIQNIDGVIFSNNKISIKNIHNIDINYSTENNYIKKTMADNWEKYLNILRKQKKLIN